MNCSHIENCELFAQFALNPALNLWKDRYCKGVFQQCNRFQLAKTGRPVPLTLLPNGKMVHTLRSREELGATALFNAILKNRAHMVGSLIKAGATIDARNIEGMTPLMAAAEQGAEDIVELLLKTGADASMVNNDNMSASDIAKQKNHESIEKLILRSTLLNTG